MQEELSAKFPELLEQYKDNLTKQFSVSFDAAWEQYQDKQQAGKKGKLRYVYVSFLRTGVLLKLPWFQIDFLDERDWGDIEECSVDWDISFITEAVYRDTVQVLDNDGMTAKYGDQLLIAAAELLMQELGKIISDIAKVKKADFPDVQFCFGEHMGDYKKA